MSFTPSATFLSLGHHMLVYFTKKSSKGEPRGGSSFRIYRVGQWNGKISKH